MDEDKIARAHGIFGIVILGIGLLWGQISNSARAADRGSRGRRTSFDALTIGGPDDPRPRNGTVRSPDDTACPAVYPDQKIRP